ncbi:MAG TPA: hypothetical protein VMW24_24240 [Sedimentisphaerales bacterium]|nr:hypothetical protein [Sedimentisphaerales bacterium]
MSDKICGCCGNRHPCDCPTVQSSQFRRIAELEAENAVLLADLSRYSHEREMNADVACALRERDAVLKELAEESARLVEACTALEAEVGKWKRERDYFYVVSEKQMDVRDDALKALAGERAKSERYRKEALDALSKLAIAQLRAAIDAAGEKS